jgi:molybdopterin molybdotransferase
MSPLPSPVGQPLHLIAADEARRILREVVPVGTEIVPIDRAAGRVLATPVFAPENAPRDRLSAMDGFAVRSADLTVASAEQPVPLRVVGTILAGTTFDGVVGPGEAVAIVTGGVLPEGADAVVMIELTRLPPDAPDAVWVERGPTVGANLVEPGEDFVAGAEVLAGGRRLRPTDVAALAAFGVIVVPVFRRPRIAVFSTGSELCPPDRMPRRGQVRDSNSYVLAAEIESAGADAFRSPVVEDDLSRLHETLARLLATHDGVILSGGSSIGPKDLTGQVLGALGAPGVLFHGIDIRPGKPTVFARVGPKPVVGMPGYPTSSMVVFEAFIRPMLARLGGEVGVVDFPAPARVRLGKAYDKPTSREDHLRVRVVEREGEPWAEVVPGGSAAISNVLRADGLVRVQAGVTRVERGDWVGLHPL